jgi:peptidoglycan/LPS O-acetylase OafA/YrhL
LSALKISFQSLVQGRQHNNLNAIRLGLAVLVILTHCFPLALGHEGDPLFWLSRQQTTFGGLAVDLFFFISGFLITASWLNCKSMNDYLRRRILRIVPGYGVALVFSFLVALAFAQHPLADLPARLGKFRDIFTLGYESTKGDWIFPGNPLPFVTNGSLWTISREFICYLLIAAIGLFGLFKYRLLILGAWALFFVYYALSMLKGIDINFSDRRFFTFFLAGTVVWLWREKIPVKHTLALLALIVGLISTQFPPLFVLLTPITACYLVLWVGFAFRIQSMAWCDKTDLSYGVYLFAFPVQQMLIALGVKSPWLVFVLATPVIMGIAFLSWKVVEKPCLDLKARDFSDHDPGLAARLQPPPATATSKVNW